MKTLSLSLLVPLTLLFSSCASMVNKDAVRAVKTAAIISVWGNGEVPERKGRGKVKNWDMKLQQDVANFAVETYTKKLQKLGWKMVSPQRVIASADYKKIARMPARADEGSGFLGKLGNFVNDKRAAATFTPQGMVAIRFNDKESSNGRHNLNQGAKDQDPREKLAKWAEALGVDAVAVVQMVYCYKGGTWSMAGTGEANMVSSASIKVVDRKGETIVNMPNETKCDGDFAAESKNTTAMIGGNLVFNGLATGKLTAMFQQATDGAATIAVHRIQEALH